MRVNLKYYCGCLVLIIWIFCFPTNANAQTFQWAAGSGGILEDIGLGMAVDYNGNSYFTGVFEGTADFDPGPGSFYMSVVAPYTHVFIVKLDSSGNFLWAKQLDGNMSGKGASIAVDSSANAYITGYFIGSGDFNPGAGVFNLVSSGTSYGDIFILKLDTNGDFIWVKQIGSTEDDQGQSIALDLNQNIYVTGYFNSSADFNPGTGVFFLTSAGNSDIFILKLDTDGNFIFALKFGGISTDSGNEIKISASGNVYTTGHFASVADFDPGPGIFNLTCGGLYDAFILKINADGNFVWAKGLGGISYDWGYSLDIDSQENVYTVGEFRDSVDVDPGPGVSNIVPVGTGKHIFISKLDSAGNFVFGKGILGSTFYDNHAFSIAIDQSGYVFIAGYFQGVTDFDPGIGVYNLTSQGNSYDLFIAKLDANGNLIFVKNVTGPWSDICTEMVLDEIGNIYLTGGFQNTANFNPPSTFNLTSYGDYDVLFMKFSACANTSSSLNISSCNYYVSPSGNYTWTSSGIYADTIYNSSGCDSVIAINLTILPFNAPLIVGDSVICQGQVTALTTTSSYASYQWSNGSIAPSIIVNTAGNYTVTVTDLNGCSGSTSFQVSLSIPSIIIVAQGNTTFCRGDSLLLVASAGLLNYQWYSYSNLIVGATAENIVVKNRGKFKCIAQNTLLCNANSNVIPVNIPCISTGPNHQRNENLVEPNFAELIISPNPGNGVFDIVSPPGQLQIFNSTGTLIYSKELYDEENVFDISAFADGIYFVKVRSKNNSQSKKIVLSHDM